MRGNRVQLLNRILEIRLVKNRIISYFNGPQLCAEKLAQVANSFCLMKKDGAIPHHLQEA